MLPRLPPQSIVIADRNFGIFSVAFAAVQAGHDALARLTEQRFRALVRRAEPVVGTDPASRCWHLTWRPSAPERRSHPDWPADAALEVVLHEVVVSPTLTLWLAATWHCPTDTAAAPYARRQEVETDIREVKVVLQTEELPARSVAMLRKELAVSIVAYNLVIQLRRLAARQAGVPPRRLSFARVERRADHPPGSEPVVDRRLATTVCVGPPRRRPAQTPEPTRPQLPPPRPHPTQQIHQRQTTTRHQMTKGSAIALTLPACLGGSLAGGRFEVLG